MDRLLGTCHSDEEAKIYLTESLQEVRQHLGIVFHRLIESGRIAVTTDQVHRVGSSSLPLTVRAIDPFGYASSGARDWPKRLSTTISGSPVNLVCHIWPAKMKSAQFRLDSANGSAKQGFYVYRGDRLLQMGGWANVMPSKRNYQLARVELLYEDVSKHISMNPEKSAIKFAPELTRAIHRAADHGIKFPDYLATAEEVTSEASKRNHVRKPSVGLDKGFSPSMKRAVRDQVGFDPTYDNLSVRWKNLPASKFVQIDFRGRVILLNNKYRPLFAGEKSGINDSPLLKTLMYLLTRETFQLENHSARAKDDIALWENLLASALQAELQFREA